MVAALDYSVSSCFEFDWRTGRVFTATRSTVYAIVINVVICTVLILQIPKQTNISVIIGKANKLHQCVILIVFGLKLATGLSIIFTRWSRRTQMMRLVKIVLRLVLKKPQVMGIFRWDILIKIIIAIVTDVFQMALTWNAISRGRAYDGLGMSLQFWMSAIVNMAISQYYLLSLLVRGFYRLLNTELRKVIDESRKLSYFPQRQGVFMTKCCNLSDQLEDISQLQSQLQSINSQMEEISGIQGLMVYCSYYIFSIATTYLTYIFLKFGHENLQITLISVILFYTLCFFYYLDAVLNLFNTLNVADDYEETMRILERTLFASTLDIRLEKSFESIQLQLIRNPLKIEVMKLFSVSRTSTMAMFGSIITNSIFLIQYDMEYF